jgi:hypothetical protein
MISTLDEKGYFLDTTVFNQCATEREEEYKEYKEEEILSTLLRFFVFYVIKTVNNMSVKLSRR